MTYPQSFLQKLIYTNSTIPETIIAKQSSAITTSSIIILQCTRNGYTFMTLIDFIPQMVELRGYIQPFLQIGCRHSLSPLPNVQSK